MASVYGNELTTAPILPNGHVQLPRKVLLHCRKFTPAQVIVIHDLRLGSIPTNGQALASWSKYVAHLDHAYIDQF